MNALHELLQTNEIYLHKGGVCSNIEVRGEFAPDCCFVVENLHMKTRMTSMKLVARDLTWTDIERSTSRQSRRTMGLICASESENYLLG